MLRFLIAIVVVAGVTSEENRWIWGKNHRNQRAFSNDQGDKYANNFYGQEKDREPTTRRPATGQPSQEDFLNPDDLRNYNVPNTFGYPQFGAGGAAPGNNFPPGFGATPGVNNPQGFPNNGYPVPSGPAQPNYPIAPSGFGNGYPMAVPGGYPPAPSNGYPVQGGFPNQGPVQGYQPSAPFPPSGGGALPGFSGYPGIGNIFGFQGQGGYPGPIPAPPQGLSPNLSRNIAGQGGYQYPGIGGAPFPIQGGGYPAQPGFIGQPGFPGPYPPTPNYAQPGGQYPAGQYTGCGQFGGLPCAGGQYPAQYPGQYPSQYTGQYPTGQYPYPDPYAAYNPNANPNPYGVTPYNRGGGYAAAFDDYDEMNKNGTNGLNRALKPEGKSFNTSSLPPKSFDDKLYKTKKA